MYNLYILECTLNNQRKMNINLGTPYEIIIKKIIDNGHAGNQTEVIRQALILYDRFLEEEEVRLVNLGIQIEMEDIKEGKIKTKNLDKILEKYEEG